MRTALTTLIALLLLVSSRGVAQTAEKDFARTLWRVSDGLPEDTVQAIAESADGVLWIGTTGGLASFDGARMQARGLISGQPLSANSIFCVAFSQDGTLWAGTEGGGLLRLRGGKLRTFTAPDGLTDEFIRTVFVDDRQQVWVGTDDGLFLVEGERLRRIDATGSVPSMAVHSITEDHLHRLWVGGSTLIAIGSDGAAHNFTLPGDYSKNRVKRILETHDGTIWVGTVGGLVRLAPGSGGDRFTPVEGIHATVRTLLEASGGTLWIGTIGDGLWTMRERTLNHVGRAGLLPSGTVLSLFEDDQKQVWIGTQSGLVRLEQTPVNVVPLPEGGDPDFETISGDTNGDIWVAAQNLYLIHNRPGEAPEARRVVYAGLKNITVRNAFRAHSGALWLGTDGSGAFCLQAGRTTHLTAPSQLTNNFIRGFLETRSGDIWVATDEGVTRVIAQQSACGSAKFERFTEQNGLAFFSTRSLLEDRSGTIWIGTDHGISSWHQGHFAEDATTRALASEKVWSILEDRAGALWFGTRDHGLYRLRDGTLKHFTMAEGLVSNSVYQILQDRSGTYWLTGPNNISSISEAELQRAAVSFNSSDPGSRPLLVSVYSMPFGADGAQMYGGRQPSGYLAADGSVWFATTRGAAHILPSLQQPAPAPHVSITDVLEDGQHVANDAGLKVAARIDRLTFDFTAVSLRPQKSVRFRYKLENFDRDWTMAGAERSATYTNLPAGDYRFRVMAFDTSSPDGSSEASLSFERQPVFYETRWFYLAVALLLGGIAFTIYQLRVRQIRSRFNAVLEERSRMAREMHDTVIQGCAGISALLEAMASAAPEHGEGDLLDYARLQARTTIDEARAAVWNMRHERENDINLIESLNFMAGQTAREFGTKVSVETPLEVLPVAASTAHEVLLTIREAVYNAVQHSGSPVVTVMLIQEDETIKVTVADQGCGFDTAILTHPPEGHFGLTGMQERMRRIGAQYRVESAHGSGTVVTLIVRNPVHSV